MRLTEAMLERQIEKHVAECEDCERLEPCEHVRNIEASFWNEVDHQIDEAKLGGYDE